MYTVKPASSKRVHRDREEIILPEPEKDVINPRMISGKEDIKDQIIQNNTWSIPPRFSIDSHGGGYEGL